MMKNHTVAVILDSEVSLELNDNRFVRFANLPGIPVFKPMIRHLHLKALLNLLFKQTVFIADPITMTRDLQICHRIKKTGRQSSQAAIAQPGISLLINQVLQVNAQLPQPFCHNFRKPQIHQVIGEEFANQKLH
ncbi:MAG: hypothetical protein A4E52_02255 [Pelotomaculum sp. PtaB.Bin013]|nr:MAG: hypothetical protein A4E52_02255 [Pelotomaculum sp. PtaB.Bin013]